MIKDSSSKKRDTVGAIVYNALSKQNRDKVPVIELQRELQKDHPTEIINCILHAQKKIPCFDYCDTDYCNKRMGMIGDFYVEVINITVPGMMGVAHRSKFTALNNCPTPNYDQTVFFYNSKNEDLTFIWTIPDRGACYLLLENAAIVAPEERELLGFVIDFASGYLFKKCKQLNGEKIDSPLLIKE